MTETLREVLRAEPFAAVRAFDDLVRFHVWHSRMGVTEAADDAAREALARGRGIVLVGPPGSGKTSTFAAAALDPEGIGPQHVPLPLTVMGVDVQTRVSDPRYLAERLVRAIAQINDEAAALVDDAASSGTATRAAAAWSAQVGAGSTKVAKEMRQRAEAVDFERSPSEVLDAAGAAVELATDRGVRLVALLEDADGLLRLPGQTAAERHDVANAFFMDGLAPLIRSLPIPIMLAVQPDYRELEGFSAITEMLGSIANAPSPSQLSNDGLRLLLEESLRNAGIERSLVDLITADGLDLLTAERYGLRSIRQVLQVCELALGHAQTLKRASVEAEDIAYALTQR